MLQIWEGMKVNRLKFYFVKYFQTFLYVHKLPTGMWSFGRALKD
jgi:hypothetical protein